MLSLGNKAKIGNQYNNRHIEINKYHKNHPRFFSEFVDNPVTINETLGVTQA
jgi:hypothetical protein